MPAHPSVTKVVLLICPLTFESIDGFKYTLPLDDVRSDGVFLAYKVDGQVLPLEHGYPLRLVAAGHRGSNWVKWVTHIEVM